MIWISIILGIIEAIPTLITLFKELAAMIHGHPLQAHHEHSLMGILLSYHASPDEGVLTQALLDLKAKL